MGSAASVRGVLSDISSISALAEDFDTILGDVGEGMAAEGANNSLGPIVKREDVLRAGSTLLLKDTVPGDGPARRRSRALDPS